MQKSELVIRPMSVRDINIVSIIHSESFPVSRSTRLGMPFLRKMYKWYVLDQPGLSVVALFDDKVVGFVTGAFGGSVTRRFRYTFGQIVWGFLCNPLLLLQSSMFASWKSHLRRSASRKRKTDSSGEGQAQVMKVTLDSIAVSFSARGTGVGKVLVGAFEQAAREKNVSILGLGVESDNLVARRLYEYCGWRLLLDDVEHNSANYVKEL